MELSYEVFGGGRGPAILLIHPLGADRRFWGDCVAIWRKDYVCVAPDLPCAGSSPCHGDPPGIDVQVQLLGRLIDDLDLRRAVAIGTAVGGMAAIALAARRPDRVAGLVVSNPGLAIRPQARAALVDRAEKLEKGGLAAILPAAVDVPFAGLPRDRRYQDYLDHFARQDPRRYARAIRGVLDADVRAEARGLRCPTLIVTGRHEALMDPADAEELHGEVRGVEKAIMENASHFAPFQDPETFAELVDQFLKRHLADA